MVSGCMRLAFSDLGPRGVRQRLTGQKLNIQRGRDLRTPMIALRSTVEGDADVTGAAYFLSHGETLSRRPSEASLGIACNDRSLVEEPPLRNTASKMSNSTSSAS